jgi:ElaB/YqjD/DUF883 family membrane-anchored ribosome-binding protein
MPQATPTVPNLATNDEAGSFPMEGQREPASFQEPPAAQASTNLKERLAALKDPARERAQALFEDLKTRTATPRAKANTFVREKPYAALGAAVVAGMMLSGLFRRR